MDVLIEALKGTPWWVYALFLYLILVGIRARRPGIIPLKKLIVLPLFFTAWSLYNLLSNYRFDSFKGILWALAVIAGGGLGWMMVRAYHVKVDQKKGLVTTHGGWMTLLLIIFIFAIRYFFGYNYAVAPYLRDDLIFFSADIISSGFITGIFIGKFLSYWHKYKVGHHTNLAPRVH